MSWLCFVDMTVKVWRSGFRLAVEDVFVVASQDNGSLLFRVREQVDQPLGSLVWLGWLFFNFFNLITDGFAKLRVFEFFCDLFVIDFCRAVFASSLKILSKGIISFGDLVLSVLPWQVTFSTLRRIEYPQIGQMP